MKKRGIWTIKRESIVKSSNDKSGDEPDIIVISQEVITDESRWKNESIIEKAESVKLIVEKENIKSVNLDDMIGLFHLLFQSLI